MSVTGSGTIRGIDMHFNTEHVPATSRKVGICKIPEYVETTHYEIDGPGGELINAIELHVHYFASDRVMWFYKEGQLNSLKAGRSYSGIVFTLCCRKS